MQEYYNNYMKEVRERDNFQNLFLDDEEKSKKLIFLKKLNDKEVKLNKDKTSSLQILKRTK